MIRNVIITLSSESGFGMKIAKLIEAESPGISIILDAKDASKYPNLIQQFIELPSTKINYFFIMPEFNGSFPAPFKALVDNLGWPNRLKGQNMFLIGYSGSWSGNLLGVNHMKAVLDYIDANLFRHSAHFTYNGKEDTIYMKEKEIMLNLLKQFHDE